MPDMAELTSIEQLEELKRNAQALDKRIEGIMHNLDLPSLDAEIHSLETKLGEPTIWNDPKEATRVNKRLSLIKDSKKIWSQLGQAARDAAELAELALAEGDPESYLADVRKAFTETEAGVNHAETRVLLSEPEDTGDAICAIQAGAGGTDAQDWASMLLRMYLRWAERMGFKATVLDEHPGEQAGIKSATFEVSGEFAYGYLKCEEGIHRLVRISPYGSNRRETSFASLDVTPVVEEAEIEIDENDLRIDTFRASGHGGQHINKTDSAVRITHIPSGLVVSCQNERSQHKNKQAAMKVLMSRLVKMEHEKQRVALETERGLKHKIQFGGGHIRNYFLHPRRQVKDSRTGYETGNAERVLDGDIQDFIETYLRAQAAGTAKAAVDVDEE
jgi:peptide chain release factor 2